MLLRLAFNDFELSTWRRLETLRREQLDGSRRCKQVQKGSCGFRLFYRGTDAGSEDDVALQFRRQPADKRDGRRVEDRRDAYHDGSRLDRFTQGLSAASFTNPVHNMLRYRAQ